MLSQEYPKYQDKHCFFDDELGDDDEEEESKAGQVFIKPIDNPATKKPDCMIEEIDEAAAVAEDSPEKR